MSKETQVVEHISILVLFDLGEAVVFVQWDGLREGLDTVKSLMP